MLSSTKAEHGPNELFQKLFFVAHCCPADPRHLRTAIAENSRQEACLELRMRSSYQTIWYTATGDDPVPLLLSSTSQLSAYHGLL